jgi:hypothetical protein
VLAGCSVTFDKIKADIPELNVQSPFPLRAGFQAIDASSLMTLEKISTSCSNLWPEQFPYGQVLKETAAGALTQLFEEIEEVKPDGAYDLVIEVRLDSMSYKPGCGFSSEDYFRAIGSMRALNQQGRPLWASTKNEERHVAAEGGVEKNHPAVYAKAISGALKLLVRGWVAELQQRHLADRLAAKTGKTREPSVSQAGAPPQQSAKSPGSKLAETPAWVQKARARKESLLAVLESSGPLDDAVRMMLSDEVRGVALKAVAEHRCSVMTRESMAVILKDMGLQCKEGDCEVETARNIGADFVVSGSVAKIEGSFVATLKLHETARGMLLAVARATAPTALELIEGIKRSSADLFK